MRCSVPGFPSVGQKCSYVKGVPFSVEGTRTPLGLEKVSVLQSVLMKQVNFKKKFMERDQENCP